MSHRGLCSWTLQKRRLLLSRLMRQKPEHQPKPLQSLCLDLGWAELGWGTRASRGRRWRGEGRRWQRRRKKPAPEFHLCIYLQPGYNQHKHKLCQQEDSNLTALCNYNNQLIFDNFKFWKLFLKWKQGELLGHGSRGRLILEGFWSSVDECA